MDHNILWGTLAKGIGRRAQSKHVLHYCTSIRRRPYVIATDLCHFPKNMINIMMSQPEFLEIQDEDYSHIVNYIALDKNGLVDPGIIGRLNGHNGATYWSGEDKSDLELTLGCHIFNCKQSGIRNTYICQIPKGTPIPDALKLWKSCHENPFYLLRAKVPLSLPNLQSLLHRF